MLRPMTCSILAGQSASPFIAITNVNYGTRSCLDAPTRSIFGLVIPSHAATKSVADSVNHEAEPSGSFIRERGVHNEKSQASR